MKNKSYLVGINLAESTVLKVDQNSSVSLEQITELRKFGNLLLQCNTVADVAAVALPKVQERLNSQVCSVFLFSKQGQIERFRIHGFDRYGNNIDNTWLAGESYLPGESFSGRAAAPSPASSDSPYGEPCIDNALDQDVPKLTNGREYADKLGFLKCGISVPLNGTHRTFGTIEVINKLNFETNHPDPDLEYSNADLCWLTLVGAHVSAAIYRLRKNEERKLYINISRCLANPENLTAFTQDTYRTITDQLIGELMPYKVCILRMLEGDSLPVTAASHTPDVDIAGKGYSIRPIDNSCLVGRVFQSQKPEIIERIEDHLDRFKSREWIQSQNLKSFICFPLAVEGEAVGVVSLYTGYVYDFTDSDHEFLTGVSYLLAACRVGIKQVNEAKRSSELTVQAQEEVKRSILGALSDQWDFRTVDGISRELNLPLSLVKKVLEENLNQLVRKSLVRDSQGRDLYCPLSKPVTWRERLATWRILLSKLPGTDLSI